MMLALSIRQPWASLIIRAGKDIENRDWPTRVRGRILVHAAKGMTHDEHEDAVMFAVDAIKRDPRNAGATKKRTLRELGMAFEDLPRGGFVGTVEVVDCVEHSFSPWFMGHYGFVLRDPQPLPFTPWKGQLGFFAVHDDGRAAARAAFEAAPPAPPRPGRGVRARAAAAAGDLFAKAQGGGA